MKITTYLLIVFSASLFGPKMLSAQDGSVPVPIPPAPNASSLMEYVNIPVNLYTGIPMIDVPLFDLKSRKLSVPIGVSYHASGIKVQDVASQVGLGWALNAGGIITRVVRGKPDEEGFCTDYYSPTHYASMLYGLCDSQPDIYYFNFLGKTGRFVMDKSGTPTLIPHQNLKIDPALGPLGQGNWVVTDENGYKYTFGLTQQDFEYTSSETMMNGEYIGGNNIEHFISTWYLSKAEDPNGIEEVTFQYLAGDDVSYEIFAERLEEIAEVSGGGGSCPTLNDDHDDSNTKIIIESPKYISSIETSLGTATFNYYQLPRKDLPGGKFLNTISIASGSTTLKEFKFNYDYFNAANTFLGPYVVYLSPPYTYSESCSDCFRLKLVSIYENGTMLREFSYNTSIDLPPRYSVFEDHWGYFNGFNNMHSYTAHPGYTSKIPGPGGARKDQKSPENEANILTKIDYPTGLATEIQYETNSVLRVEKIIDWDGGQIKNEREFLYYNGSQFAVPTYKFHTTNYAGSQGHGIKIGALSISVSEDCWVEYNHISSTSYNSLFDLNGTTLGYGKVSVVQNGILRDDYSFTNFTDRPDEQPVISYSVAFEGDLLLPGLPVDPLGPPFSPFTTKFWERSLMIEKETYAKQGANFSLIERETYDYDFEQPNLKEIDGVAVMSLIQTINVVTGAYHPIYHFGKYKVISKPLLLEEVTREIYDQFDPGNESKKLVSTVDYSYEPVEQPGTGPALDLLLRKSILTMPDGERIVIENKYVTDYTAPTGTVTDLAARGIQLLRSKKMDNSLIESINYSEKTDGGITTKMLIGGNLNQFIEYPSGSGKVHKEETLRLLTPFGVPFSIHPWSEIENNSFSYEPLNFKPGNTFVSYDGFGNPTASKDEGGVTYNYSWINNSSLLGSMTVNSGDFEQTTSFQYSPLVGITQITDANGQNSSYSYDRLERLKLVRDNALNIVSRYRYHYAGDSEFSVDFSLSDNFSGIPISFVSENNLEDHGTNKYTWDFGDGEVLETTSANVNHTYSSAGTYTVKLSKINPEYGSVMETKVIPIYAQMGGSINGPSSINLCDPGSYEFSLSATGGCPGTKTYNWSVTYPGGSSTLGSGSTINYNTVNITGNYEFKCTVTDACGHQYMPTKMVNVYKQGGCP